MKLRITSWNLQGREGVDVDRVASMLIRLAPGAVVLQEVQRRQAAALAKRLGWQHRWWFKHWTVVHPAEGLAILSPQPLLGERWVNLAHRWQFWSWRRRVAVMAHVEGTLVVDVHLGSGVGDAERARQAAVVLSEIDDVGPVVIAGDFNTRPDSEVMETFAEAGFVDGWTRVHADLASATNWRTGPRSGPPTQLLDYVLARGDLEPVAAVIGDSPEPDWEGLASLSDHAPITVTLKSG